MLNKHDQAPVVGISSSIPGIALTIDLEDWHDGLQLTPAEARVAEHTEWLLETFERLQVKATFFTLGTIASKHPHLVRRIAELGHEIGFHGARHLFLHKVGRQNFDAELRYWRPKLQDLTGQPIGGYRAPYFSITRKTRWALDALANAGFDYDASVYPGINDRYGWPGAPREPVRLAGRQLIEFPVPVLPLAKFGMAYSGGAYLRILPKRLVQLAMWLHLRTGAPGMIYAHPFEAAQWLRWRRQASFRANVTRHLFRQRFRQRLELLLGHWQANVTTMASVIEGLGQLKEWRPEAATLANCA